MNDDYITKEQKTNWTKTLMTGLVWKLCLIPRSIITRKGDRNYWSLALNEGNHRSMMDSLTKS